MSIVCEPFGPEYPELGAGVAKFRRIAAKVGSVRAMARADVVAYADAIEKAIRAKHRTMHMRPTPSVTAKITAPSIVRLFRYDNPIPMQGDPPWKPSNVNACQWAAREKAVYAHAMKQKRVAP